VRRSGTLRTRAHSVRHRPEHVRVGQSGGLVDVLLREHEFATVDRPGHIVLTAATGEAALSVTLVCAENLAPVVDLLVPVVNTGTAARLLHVRLSLSLQRLSQRLLCRLETSQVGVDL